MKSKSITYTKNHFSALVREVQEGASYLVCDHGRPVAVLEPVCASDADVSRRNMADMEKSGIVKRGKAKLSRDFFSGELPTAGDGASVVDALLEEREQGR